MKLETLNDGASATLIGSIYIPSDEEIERYCAMRDEYLKRLAKEPLANRYYFAMSIGAKAFGIPIPALQAVRDQKQPRLSEDRQRLMAFSRVVSFGHRLNSWMGIARVFHRSHAAVINATHKYGDEIAAALEMKR